MKETVLSRDDNVEEIAKESSSPMVDNLRLVEPEKEVEIVVELGGKEQEATAQDDATVIEQTVGPVEGLEQEMPHLKYILIFVPLSFDVAELCN